VAAEGPGCSIVPRPARREKLDAAPGLYTESACIRYNGMATKTVALDDEAYELLKRQRKADESFSDTVKRLARQRRPITSFRGIWRDMSGTERTELDRAYSQLRAADRRRSEKIRRSWS
jgi:predicted CopG family antitoxin